MLLCFCLVTVLSSLLLGPVQVQGADLRPSNRNVRETTPEYYWESDLGPFDIDVTAGNPLKGLCTSPRYFHDRTYYEDYVSSSLEFNYLALDKTVIGDPEVMGSDAYDWADLEEVLNLAASRNKHAIPRFWIHYPDKYAVPQYVYDQGFTIADPAEGPDWTDPRLLNLVQRFIFEFADKYDGDQRIGFLQLGLIGRWGEWNGSTLPESVKDTVSQWFVQAFSKTRLLTRYPNPRLVGTDIGVHDDSFTYSTLDGEYNGGVKKSWFTWPDMIRSDLTEQWKIAVIGGETRPRTGPVFSPDYPAGTEYNQDFDECVHVTHTTWITYTRAFKEDGMGADEVENARRSAVLMGYTFYVSNVAATSNPTSSGDFHVDVTLEQRGVAPFYFPLSLNLNCKGLAQPIAVDGVDSLIEQGQSGTFRFSGVPTSVECLDQVSLTLRSSKLYEGRPIKFAQGGGTISFAVPLPPPVYPTPISQPTSQPTSSPTFQLTISPTVSPTSVPTNQPTNNPTSQPTSSPTSRATSLPTASPASPFDPTPSAVEGFVLIDSSTDAPIGLLPDGATINLSTSGTSLNVDAITSDAVKQVVFKFDGSYIRTEGKAPWALGGNGGSNFYDFAPLVAVGIHEIEATAFNDAGEEIGNLHVTVKVVSWEFILIDSNSDAPIGPISDGSTISLSETGVSLNVDAIMDESVARVIFTFDGSYVRTEGKAPWALGGNAGSDFRDFPALATVGMHDIEAIGFDDGGEEIGSVRMTVNVVI